MKKKKHTILVVFGIIIGIIGILAGIGMATFGGVKMMLLLKERVHISVDLAGSPQDGKDTIFHWSMNDELQSESEKEEDKEESSEKKEEEQTEDGTQGEPKGEVPGDSFGGGEFFSDFGLYGEDSDLAKALKEGLEEQDEAHNPFLKEDFAGHLGINHMNHDRSEFNGQYYENICDSIDYNVPYGIERKYYEYLDPDKDITVQLSCVQLSGELQGIEEMNKQIYEKTVEFALMYSYQGSSDGNTKKLIQVDSYITYNDDTTMSIILDELYETSTGRYMDLYDMNINLQTASILKDDMLKVDEAFVKEFRKRSEQQNGKDNPGLDKLDDDMLQNYLKNEFTNIVFYTPLGMEIGVNYEVNNTVGWVTVTYKDYEKYLNAA